MTTSRTWRAGAAAGMAALALTVAACGGGASRDRAAGGDRGWLGEGGNPVWSAREAGGDPAMAAEAYSAAAPGATARATTEATVGPADQPTASLGLNAGSVDDNVAWEDYLRYREAYQAAGKPFHDLAVEGRQLVTVVDGAGRPVLGALVAFTGPDGFRQEARTAADGRVLLLGPRTTPAGPAEQQQQASSPFHAKVTLGDATVEADLDPATLTHRIVLDGAPQPSTVKLDVEFLIDATGSMGDEIERLKAHMAAVAEQVAALPGSPDVRFAMTVYRDQGDLFLTRTFDFTADVGAFTAALREVVAGGGGDTPEALSEALAAGLDQPAWRGDDTIKLAVLVADAEPHIERTPDYVDTVGRYRDAGVKILPVASSGSSDEAEFVFRQLAQATLGRFTFLTYGADGASPGDTTNLHVDGYSVLALDQLVTKLVADEVAARA